MNFGHALPKTLNGIFRFQNYFSGDLMARTMPARRANTRDSSKRLGEKAMCRSTLAEMAGRHDLGTLLQGDC
jgi:hypothetical protein